MLELSFPANQPKNNLYAKMEFVTPAQAQAILANKNPKNRTVKWNYVQYLANEIKKGTLHQTHQGLAFFEDGELADGQHRLLAIVEAKQGAWLLVTYNLTREAGLVIDTHRKRQPHDNFSMHGEDWANKDMVAIIRFLSGGIGNSPR